MFTLSLLLAAIFSHLITAAMIPAPYVPVIKNYRIKDSFKPRYFFDEFNQFDTSDSRHGFVQYVDGPTAHSQKLVDTTTTGNSSIYIGVDHVNKAPHGRTSVRVSTQRTYNQGLFIADIAHMPGGICGVWPAFWLVGPNHGEIDIIEGTNERVRNSMTLHTNDQCPLFPVTSFLGKVDGKICGVKASKTNPNPTVGCSISAPDGYIGSYGEEFNKAGGGVFVTEWTLDTVSIWFFPRGKIPDELDISNGLDTRDVGPTTDTSKWGWPLAHFAPNCVVKNQLHDMRLLFATTFCGQWASENWSETCKASTKTATCEEYVANNPEAFKEAYWKVNEVRVYERVSKLFGHH